MSFFKTNFLEIPIAVWALVACALILFIIYKLRERKGRRVHIKGKDALKELRQEQEKICSEKRIKMVYLIKEAVDNNVRVVLVVHTESLIILAQEYLMRFKLADDKLTSISVGLPQDLDCLLISFERECI